MKFQALGDTESEDDDEEASRDLSATESRPRWLEIMSTDRVGETLREAARSCADEYHLLCLGALSYERLKVLQDCVEKRRRGQQSLRMPHNGRDKVLAAKMMLLDVESQRKQTLAELEASDFLNLTAEDRNVSEFEDRVEKQLGMISSWEIAFHDWVRKLNSLTPQSFAEKVTLLRVEYGQENLMRFLQSLSLELPWTRVVARVRRMKGIEHFASGSFELSPWELFKPQERNFCVVGCEELTGFTEGPDLAAFVASLSTEKFEEKEVPGICRGAWQVLRELGGKALPTAGCFCFQICVAF